MVSPAGPLPERGGRKENTLLFPLVDNQKTLRALSGKFRDFRKSTLLSALYAGPLYFRQVHRAPATRQTGFRTPMSQVRR